MGAGGQPQRRYLLSPQGTFGCQSASEMMQFYMEEVLPSAMRTSTLHQQSMGDLGNLLRNLKAMMKRCVSGAQHHGVGGMKPVLQQGRDEQQGVERVLGFPRSSDTGWCRGAGLWAFTS